MADNLSIYLAELDLPTRHGTRGYKRLADFMAWDPSTAILPRFRSANMFNLLGLQAEVCRLQDELMHLIERDSENAEQPQKDYANDWSVLQAGENGKSEQRLKILELRTKIAEYNTALIQQTTINQQSSPNTTDLFRLQHWLKSREGGNSELRGSGSDAWFRADGNTADLLSLNPLITDQDPFSKLIRYNLWRLFSALPFIPVKQRIFPTRNSTEAQGAYTIYSSSDTLISVGNKVAAILASLVTTMPILILRFVPSINWRLGLIVLFTFLFSSTLAFMSNPRRAELFGASAAFAAVQVVFVGSVGIGNGTG